MPNVFGKEEHQYEHLQVLRAAGALDGHMEAYGNIYGLEPKDQWRGLGRFRGQRNLPGGDLSRGEGNAQSIGFLTNNLLAIQTEIDEVMYLENRLDDFIPMNMNPGAEQGMDPEGATEYGVIVEDWSGEAEFADFYGTTAPRVNISRVLPKNPLYLLALDAEWTLEDIRNAAFTGLPLMQRSIEYATRGTLNKIERFAYFGDDRLGCAGIVNIPTTDVTYNKTSAVVFTSSTGRQVLEFLTQAISDVIETTHEIFGRTIREGLCIFLPTKQFNQVTSKRIGDDLNRTIWAALMEDNPWTHMTNGNPVMLKSMAELAGAGAGNVDRMIVAVKNMRVYEMGVAFMPRSITTIDAGRVINVPVEAKVSPIFFKRANTLHYYDGI